MHRKLCLEPVVNNYSQPWKAETGGMHTFGAMREIITSFRMQGVTEAFLI